MECADAEKEHIGLTTWEAAPDGKIVKTDVSIAKNYLSDKEMSYIQRIVSLYHDYAKLHNHEYGGLGEKAGRVLGI